MTYNEWKAKYVQNETANPAQDLFNAFRRWLNKTPKAWKLYLELPRDENGNIDMNIKDLFRILEANGVEFPTKED